MITNEVKQARFSENFKYIINSDGQRVELHDSGIVHILTIGMSPYSSAIISNLYQKNNLKCRIIGGADTLTLQYAKNFCSGRECLPCAAITGATIKDILNNREKDEISIYYNLDQDGPCQNGAWPLVWETFARRINFKNVIFCAQPTARNNFLGLGIKFVVALTFAIIMGDLLDEAENTIKCIGHGKDEILRKFEIETDLLIENIKDGVWAIKPALKNWAEKMSQMPCMGTIKEIPKVLIFGGLNVIFLHNPITNFFIEQGIIPKVVDFTEGASWIASEHVMRYGLMRGWITPEKQFNLILIFLSYLFRKENRKEALSAIKSRVALAVVDLYKRRYRKIMKKSGLLFDRHISFPRIVREGHKYVSFNGYSETPVTTGRYICSIKAGVFDGLINLGSFNCQPAMNSQAIIRPLANRSSIPYVSIDCEGPWISTNQRKLLEVVAVQARRVCEDKLSKTFQFLLF